MMPFLFKNATILDVEYQQEYVADILIEKGLITQIDANITTAAQVIDATGKYLSIGWMDMHVHLREPGFEHKETIETGTKAAAFGGFTAVACMPNTNPPIHTRDVVEFIIAKAMQTPVDVYPIGTVSKNREGKELAEMADMQTGGAVAFSDDGAPVQNAGLMRHALEYAAMLDVPIINHEEDLDLNPHGQMHEGSVSTRLGLRGIPALSEEVMIARDILLSEFTGGHVHVAHISTAKAVALVRQAKKQGIKVSTEVCPHHFTLTDEAVEKSEFDTNTKMHPPLRTAADVAAMKEGLRDGTIDVICTDHAPHAGFEKEVEYAAAPFGILGLETCWGLTGKALIQQGVLSTQAAVYKLAVAPRQILRLPIPQIKVGEKANFTLFDAHTEWVFQAHHIKSKSKNTPYVGETMIGKAFGIFNKGQWIANED